MASPTNSPQPISISDYEALACRCMTPSAWAYFAGGAADETTMGWNCAAYDRHAIVPRVLNGGRSVDPSVELLGRRRAYPILVAPVAFQRMAHPDGEIATAAAASAQDAVMVLSSQSSTAMEDAAAAGDTCRWFQLYIQPVRAATLALVRRAEASGYDCLIVTVDAPVNGVRDRERRAGFVLPPGIEAVNLKDLPVAAGDESQSGSALQNLIMAAPNWSDIAWLRSQTTLPIVLKGILSPDDAERAIAAGCDGIVVSNHGGRTLDTAIASLDALPDVVARVAGRVPVLMDGGIRRGTDVLKALALGATAVLVGRPCVYGLSVAGAYGVAHVLRLLRDEFEIAMALAGCNAVSEIGPHLLWRRPRD